MSAHDPTRPLKAFDDPEFLHSPEARPLRILAEYLEPRTRLNEHKIRDTLVFFGSARFVDSETAERLLEQAATPEEKAIAQQALGGAKYYEDARRLAHDLTKWAGQMSEDSERHFVICSGGGPGIMEAANRGATEAGGKSIGFNISLPFEQRPNPYITPELSFDFHYFFMRKLWFAYLGKALIAFPGGYGTLDELLEMLTLVQTDKLRKPILILLYGSSYWDKVMNLEALAEFGTISPEDLDLFKRADDPEAAFRLVTTWLSEKYP